jgi:soluble cytochrome b562
MNMELHAKGASFIATASDHNPRDLVVEVVKANPELGAKEQFEQFRALLQDVGDDYQRKVEWYFFVNMRDYLVNTRARNLDPIERTQRQAEQRDRIESIKAQIVMLDLTMPNGKPMRDCTGAEMAKFGNRFQKLAERVGKAKTVGSVLSEDQVKEIMK